ncbi:hypothetical protein DDJ44_06580 [Salmonella enterica]|uniref:Uncharacterized protein n=1 Tax=Salmonella enterica TaxID=28901 RepID=A0A5T2E7U9_SALER|nr:hypothetical protein [Salmonella enterica]EBW0192303.1 hypothetical protein [Salmonella enterica subsp. enterica serovar Norwich]EBW0200385.1 hypothetical protein [Salmonella enterica subsp. enterica serovar Senftenberg]EBY0372722.1 hypothetical protein [Salmonella enterica subsp. enterica serovar Toulon]ECT4811016.1 hypothetical protein [Salmonella enterica subsp. enterica serovar Rubislaw]ECV4715941.1 hypothetical protein [Salmonella enterica subsp. enterica serovar Java]PVI91669.1 hypot
MNGSGGNTGINQGVSYKLLVLMHVGMSMNAFAFEHGYVYASHIKMQVQLIRINNQQIFIK